ncbi:MAG: DinB family protein [Candidatus Hydrogenedentes bacterium]|nr:DinB family protein [Candidatus Hydrogenedentota bacterium]
MTTKETIKSQYRAALEMLGEAIANCTDALWDDPEHQNRFWHIAYHTLFFTHLYLQECEEKFVAWSKHRNEYQFLGPLPWPPHKQPSIEKPYTRDEILEYLGVCRNEVEQRVSAVDLEAASGFHWLPFNKLELQFYNIRHIQHHTGQLIDRLRTKANIGIPWVGMKSKQPA